MTVFRDYRSSTKESADQLHQGWKWSKSFIQHMIFKLNLERQLEVSQELQKRRNKFKQRENHEQIKRDKKQHAMIRKQQTGWYD